MAQSVVYFTHTIWPFHPDTAVQHPHRAAAIMTIEALKPTVDELYCSAIIGESVVTKRVNGSDLVGLLTDMADEAIKSDSVAHQKRYTPPEPAEKRTAPRADSFTPARSRARHGG